MIYLGSLFILFVILIKMKSYLLDVPNDYIKKISNFNTFIYSIAWEDPRVDKKHLNIKCNDNILMITTGGCNVLNTLLLNPNKIVSCDLSSAQNALLDIKLASIKVLEYDDYWKLFGLGKHDNFEFIYNSILKKELKLYSSGVFWDNNIDIFTKKGLYNSDKMSEGVAILNIFMKNKLIKLCNISDVKVQYKYYKNNICNLLFNKLSSLFLKYLAMEFAGVPSSQIRIITNDIDSNNKFYKFIENSYDVVCKRWSIRDDNYFYYGLLMGYFRKNNCPDYLKEENYNFLKENVEKINIFNGSLNDYMRNNNIKLDKFILLDHMDWYNNESEIDELFNLILKSSNEGGEGIFRSASSNSWIIDKIRSNKNIELIDLCYEYENDRLGTYPGYFKFKII